MIYGLHLSAQGAQAQSLRLDVVANNLANAQTGGFKRDLAIFQAHHPHDVEEGVPPEGPEHFEEATGGVSLAGVLTDFSNGPLTATGGTYDVALAGPGFFRVGDGEGELLTRNGRLTIDPTGQLVTQESGRPVLADDGTPIVFPPIMDDVEITSDGSVFTITDGIRNRIARLGLARPESLDGLQKVGQTFFRTGGEILPAGPEARVMHGYIEGSGVQSIQEMMTMIDASRAFESNVTMMKFQDDALGRLLQSLPRR